MVPSAAAAHTPTSTQTACNGARAMQHAAVAAQSPHIQVAHILSTAAHMGLPCAIPRLFSIPLAAYCIFRTTQTHAVTQLNVKFGIYYSWS